MLDRERLDETRKTCQHLIAGQSAARLLRGWNDALRRREVDENFRSVVARANGASHFAEVGALHSDICRCRYFAARTPQAEALRESSPTHSSGITHKVQALG